ncbi:alpha-L-fucosidase [Companilactobacillus zhachilii]|uniref:alpha-L-fucosidase n=1 Tax=Companilactobacillus zhachilii TaxID=2304606 RepID=A0A386PTP1_9LACO|nr:alpha-L-fucosidase [Companilactobacillus zhachilii]AYE37750.1 alpha-L-fucosidase [Companilactobacillus zhachilii]
MNENMKWFKEAKYGMMIHWGLYSLLAGEYDGRSSSNYAEWIQSKLQIPNAEYEKLTEAFNPIYFDADKIVNLAKNVGMSYLVVTTKHHDGFAMYKSEVDKYNIVDSTPFHRDIIKELADASKKAGLKFGIYYSQDLDWHDYNGGGYKSNDIETAGTTWDNSWDFTGEKDYDICFENKIMPQIEELMTNYGEISTAWFDVPMTLTEAQSKRIYDTVKKLQPNCLINSRLGNGEYDYVSLGDNEIPETTEVTENGAEVDYNAVDGLKPSPNGLYETAGTMNDSWGFSYHDQNWKAPEDIYKYKKHLNGLGINYLLNVGLDGLGRIPMNSIDNLKAVKELENND